MLWLECGLGLIGRGISYVLWMNCELRAAERDVELERGEFGIKW